MEKYQKRSTSSITNDLEQINIRIAENTPAENLQRLMLISDKSFRSAQSANYLTLTESFNTGSFASSIRIRSQVENNKLVVEASGHRRVLFVKELLETYGIESDCEDRYAQARFTIPRSEFSRIDRIVKQLDGVKDK